MRELLLYSSVNYKNGGIFYRSARDGYGFEANWSEFYTTTRKLAGDVGAYTQAECNQVYYRYSPGRSVIC
ncbi:hypothetical protein JE86ST02C_670 (plasmid) [Escherichia coli]|nr:hypothetical protein JE86ST02C_670 [Escherichia coli]